MDKLNQGTSNSRQNKIRTEAGADLEYLPTHAYENLQVVIHTNNDVSVNDVEKQQEEIRLDSLLV